MRRIKKIESVWAPVKGYEGLYEVSTNGQVKSLERISPQGHLLKERILKPAKDRGGYLRVVLCKDGKSKHYLIHRLVAEAFLDNPDNLPCVNHRDEDKTNNRANNLEFCTHQYNNTFGTRIERVSKKESKSVIGINPDNGEIVIEFQSTMEAGRNGFSQGTVAACCRGVKRYKTYKGLIWRYRDDFLKKIS